MPSPIARLPGPTYSDCDTWTALRFIGGDEDPVLACFDPRWPNLKWQRPNLNLTSNLACR